MYPSGYQLGNGFRNRYSVTLAVYDLATIAQCCILQSQRALDVLVWSIQFRGGLSIGPLRGRERRVRS